LVVNALYQSAEGIKMSSVEIEDGLTSILQHGLVASAIIEVDLSSPRSHDGIIGVTTDNTVITWQVDGMPRRYRGSKVPVRFRESKEDSIELDVDTAGAANRLRLLINHCHWPSLTSVSKIKRLRPIHLVIEVAKLEVIAGTYFGEIDSYHATF
jgi:hypothetical protein